MAVAAIMDLVQSVEKYVTDATFLSNTVKKL